jgi:transposase-like protein
MPATMEYFECPDCKAMTIHSLYESGSGTQYKCLNCEYDRTITYTGAILFEKRRPIEEE